MLRYCLLNRCSCVIVRSYRACHPLGAHPMRPHASLRYEPLELRLYLTIASSRSPLLAHPAQPDSASTPRRHPGTPIKRDLRTLESAIPSVAGPRFPTLTYGQSLARHCNLLANASVGAIDPRGTQAPARIDASSPRKPILARFMAFLDDWSSRSTQAIRRRNGPDVTDEAVAWRLFQAVRRLGGR